MGIDTESRMATVRQHLDTYDREGRAIKREADRIDRIRRRVNSGGSVLLAFNDGSNNGVLVAEFTDPEDAIVLSDPMRERRACHSVQGGRHSQSLHIVKEMARASEIAYPGLKACLLMWLNEWEVRVKRDLAVWESRDPIAEAAALAPAATP